MNSNQNIKEVMKNLLKNHTEQSQLIDTLFENLNIDIIYPNSNSGLPKQELDVLPSNDSGDMTEEELAVHFKEALPTKKKEMNVSTMTLEEIQEWESKQENNNDIYKIAARVKNLARNGDGNLTANLTPTGEALCNTFVHIVKAYYDFAETLTDKETKIKLMELTRKQEGIPGSFIAAMHVGVKV